MVIQKKTGVLQWTPTLAQTGTYSVTATAAGSLGTQTLKFAVKVNAGNADPVGLYVAPNGDDAAPGTADRPFKTLQAAAKVVTPGTTIYLRGGDYYNAEYQAPAAGRAINNLARFTTVATAANPIIIRPLGNEYVRLRSDVDGLVFANARYFVVQGLEFEGTAASITYDTAMNNWWVEDGNLMSGRGVVNAASQHITITDCVIHDFAGAGIASNDADWITVRDNIIYNNGWWTTGGVHGVANSKLTTTDTTTANAEKMILQGNLVFSNQSLIISHVFSKGAVTLTIDEGNGLHLQNNLGTYQGRARVENNLLLFNGKAGVGLNTIDRVSLLRNSFYQNNRVVDTGEIVLQASTLTDASNNLIHPRTTRTTIKDSSKAYTNVNANATVGTNTDGTSFPSVQRLSAVFKAPESLDFSPAAGVPSGMGVPATELTRMFAKVKEYGIVIKEPTQVVDAAYLQGMKAFIFANWPASQNTLTLTDSATGSVYNYSQRCHFPGPPTTTPCP
jgi:hypothetical protein